jgi:hypothetical protein
MLNDSQRTSLKIALRLVDEQMKKIEAVLENPREVGAIYEFHDDLSPAMRELIPGKVAAIRAILKDVKDRFTLSPEIIVASREAFKSLPYLWQVLQESTSARLRRYGEVDPRLGPALDPELKKLEKLLMEMESILFVPRKSEDSAVSGNQSLSGMTGRSK